MGARIEQLRDEGAILKDIEEACELLQEILSKMMTKACCKTHAELTIIDIDSHIGTNTDVGNVLLSHWAHILTDLGIDENAKSQLHLLASSDAAGYRAANSIIAKLLVKLALGEDRDMSKTLMSYVSNARYNIDSWVYNEATMRCNPSKPAIDFSMIEQMSSKGKGKRHNETGKNASNIGSTSTIENRIGKRPERQAPPDPTAHWQTSSSTWSEHEQAHRPADTAWWQDPNKQWYFRNTTTSNEWQLCRNVY